MAKRKRLPQLWGTRGAGEGGLCADEDVMPIIEVRKVAYVKRGEDQGWIVTANDDGSVGINGKVIAELSATTDEVAEEIVRRWNALRALESAASSSCPLTRMGAQGRGGMRGRIGIRR